MVLTAKHRTIHAPTIKKEANTFFSYGNPTSVATPFFQPKLTVNQPNDVYEKETDSIAEQVMKAPVKEPSVKSEPVINREPSLRSKPSIHEAITPVISPATKIESLQRNEPAAEEEEQEFNKGRMSTAGDKIMDNNPGIDISGHEYDVQRKCAECEEEQGKISRKENGNQPTSSTASVGQTLSSPGQPLPAETRSFMEVGFGYDFSDVKIHDDSLAHQSSSDINALAYTHKNHIAFAAGQYQPGSNAGKQLLAHELTHVVQQQNKVQTQGLIQTQRTGSRSPTEILNMDAHTTTAYRDAVQHWPGANSIWDVLTSVNAKINFLRFILSFDETNCVRYDATDTNTGETCSATASAVTRFTNACQGYASQMYARYTSSGRLSATAEANLQSQANIVIGVVPVKFQIPIRIVTVPGHAFNAVLVDANPADANSWVFFEPQNDRIFFATDPLLRSSVYAGTGIFSLSSLTDFTSTGQYVQTDDRSFLLNSSNLFTNAAITPSQRITLDNLFRDIFIADDLSSYPFYTTHHTPPQTYEELVASHSTNDINTLALAFNSSLSGRSFRRTPGGTAEIMTRAIYLQLLNNPSGLAALIP